MNIDKFPDFRALKATALIAMWWPVLVFACFAMWVEVDQRYFGSLLAASGIKTGPSLSDFLFLYRHDVLLLGVLLPVATALCATRFRLKYVAIISFLLILIIQLLLFANLQSWGQVGNFLTWQAMSNSISFGLSNPEFVGEYIDLDSIVKMSVLLGWSIFVAVFAVKIAANSKLLKWANSFCLLSVTLCTMVGVGGFFSGIKSVPISNSFVGNAFAALGGMQSARAVTIDNADLNARYASLAHITDKNVQGPNFGVHKGSNLLIFVMETASIEFLDVRKGLPAHPALDALKAKSYVASNHFSTFPASAEGNLSILTGAYPPNTIYGTCLIDVPRQGGRLPGPIAQLQDEGHQTAIYAPFKSQVPADRVVFEATGFKKIFYGEESAGSGTPDERSFQQLLSDLDRWGTAKQPFAIGFYPQVGHGPWAKKLGKSVQERGHTMVLRQLDWLGKIVAALRKSGQLENTVIVLTGDHGVRTTAEDPRVAVGMIDAYSFHVPLVVYAPKADYQSVKPDLPSSHIDVAAELSALFGKVGLPSYQGLPFHHPDRAKRREFLMAGWYYGANGYHDGDSAAMYSNPLDAVYRRPENQVHFGIDQLVTNRAERDKIKSDILDMAALQEVWIKERLCPQNGKKAKG